MIRRLLVLTVIPALGFSTVTGIARAQATADSSSSADADTRAAGSKDSVPAGMIELNRLKYGSLVIYSENDKYFAGTDRRYTNGLKISVLSTELESLRGPRVPGVARSIAGAAQDIVESRKLPKIGFSLGQNIYTPTDTEATAYLPDDRPYAGWLYLGAALHNYHRADLKPGESSGVARLEVFEVNLGVVGPSALGERVQNAVHRLIDVESAKGWDNQIHNEPGLNMIYESKWRLSTRGARDAWGADFIPHAGVCLGNVFTYANVGAEVRAGYRLPDDFGASLIRPSGDSSAEQRTRFNAFFFVLTDWRAVARDITLDGNTWRDDSPSIKKKNYVFDLSAGFGIGGAHWQITYAQAWRSQEFVLQDDWQQFGSLSIAWFF